MRNARKLIDCIKELMKQCSYSVYRLSKLADIPFQTLYRSLNISYNMELDNFEKICRVFNIDLVTMLTKNTMFLFVNEDEYLTIKELRSLSSEESTTIEQTISGLNQ